MRRVDVALIVCPDQRRRLDGGRALQLDFVARKHHLLARWGEGDHWWNSDGGRYSRCNNQSVSNTCEVKMKLVAQIDALTAREVQEWKDSFECVAVAQCVLLSHAVVSDPLGDFTVTLQIVVIVERSGRNIHKRIYRELQAHQANGTDYEHFLQGQVVESLHVNRHDFIV